MKTFIFLLLASTSFFCSPSLYARGKTHSHSSASPLKTTENAQAAGSAPSPIAYTSSTTTTNTTFGVNPVAINFQSDLATPIGIMHPVSGNEAQFQIANAGVYQLFWTINVLWPESSINSVTTVVVALIKSQPMPAVSVATIQHNEGLSESVQLFGQMIVPLDAGETLSLEICNTEGESLEVAPTSIFTICQLTP